MGDREGESVPGHTGGGHSEGSVTGTGRQLLGALPKDVRKTHMSESIRVTSKGPVLDTLESSPADTPIGTQTLLPELLPAVGAGDVAVTESKV
jgi:hypothetical protein